MLSFLASFITKKSIGLFALFAIIAFLGFRCYLLENDCNHLNLQIKTLTSQLEVSEHNNKNLSSIISNNDKKYKDAITALQESINKERELFNEQLKSANEQLALVLEAKSTPITDVPQVVNVPTSNKFVSAINKKLSTWSAKRGKK